MLLLIFTPDTLWKTLFYNTIDLFAAANNNQVETYVSWLPDITLEALKLLGLSSL